MISAKPGALKETRPHEYLVRFAFGGAACVLAGLVARKFGAGIGGLFLAFPAIFPASATLIESHVKRRAAEHGRPNERSGRKEAGTDAAGTAVGCLGLAGFGFTLWRLLPPFGGWVAIPAAAAAWAVIAVGVWAIRKDRW